MWPQRLGKTWSSNWIARRARVLVLLHGADELRDVAVARVRVGDDGDGDGRRDAPQVVGVLGQRRDAEVGQAVRGGGGRVAAPVEGLEAGPLQQPCRERVEGAGDDEHVAAGEAVA